MTIQVNWKRCSDELPEMCNHAVGSENCRVSWSDDCWVCTGAGAISVGYCYNNAEWVVSDSGIELLEIDWNYGFAKHIEYWAPFILPEPPDTTK